MVAAPETRSQYLAQPVKGNSMCCRSSHSRCGCLLPLLGVQYKGLVRPVACAGFSPLDGLAPLEAPLWAAVGPPMQTPQVRQPEVVAAVGVNVRARRQSHVHLAQPTGWHGGTSPTTAVQHRGQPTGWHGGTAPTTCVVRVGMGHGAFRVIRSQNPLTAHHRSSRGHSPYDMAQHGLEWATAPSA